MSKQAQTITFTLATTGMVNDKPALTATATSTLPVTFTSSDDMVAAIGTGADAGMLVLKAAGTATITASQSGNDMYAAAPPVTQTIDVAAAVPSSAWYSAWKRPPMASPSSPTRLPASCTSASRSRSSASTASKGRLLETGKNVRSVDITARPAGLYFVEVVRGERSLRWRVVRE